ncbi:hypothetical protein [Phormidium nigroviride]
MSPLNCYTGCVSGKEKEEGRRKKEEGRRKREEGRGKKEEGRRKRGLVLT